MNLDPRTLLFALILTNVMMALSLFVAAGGKDKQRDGMRLWAMAMLLETLTWILVAARGAIPDVLSLVVANGFKAGAHALALAAICEFQRRPVPRWQYFVPIALAMVMAALLADDIRGRFVWGSLIFAFQLALIARMLLTDRETRAGRAWRLLFGGIVGMLLVLGLRAAAALSGYAEFAQPQNAIAPHPVQIVSFIAIMATALIGSVGFILMVKERTDREVLELAMTDSLTGIPNRRALMELAEHALARRGGSPMTLMMIDVDHFKRINDTYGHPVGDTVLRQVTRLLAGRLRGGDVLGRYGGEEFCVLAPDTDAEGARTLAESLREIIAFKTLSSENGPVQVTVSIGVACCPDDKARELKDLLAEADAALYAAKEAGRNRVVSFTC
ncbi:MAG: GGDEF domain-containing protein [Gallionella sp.]|jgi:diguanylate cyclase (GGDEF)-like protein|nr:GGDEF domain-containing protein [Gallionella sp.]MCK9354177.1 GGDEF domain-containing protein [Gallionella sp.]